MNDEITYWEDIGQGEISEDLLGFQKTAKGPKTIPSLEMQMQEGRNNARANSTKSSSFRIHAPKFGSYWWLPGPLALALLVHDLESLSRIRALQLAIRRTS